MRKTIILNKTFEGTWTEKEGNIAHEIIDFIKTDKGEHYIYNNPLGQCPQDIVLAGSGSKESDREVKYILLCSPSKIYYKKDENGNYIKNANEQKILDYCDFYINYCAEIEEILHNKSRKMNNLSQIRNEIENIIRKKEIKYNGKYLYEIYGDDDPTLLVTFKIKKMWQPKGNNYSKITTKKYKFQRNKGYIDSNNYPNDYETIIKTIENNGKIDTSKWEEVILPSLTRNATNYNTRSFLDLICKKDSEECYTNILQSILNQKNLLNKFCEEFDKKGSFDKNNKSYENLVKREQNVDDGRIDISADNGHQKIIIENKIYSGLNGIHKEDKISQLSTYYKWGKQSSNSSPCCFIICPNFKIKEIESEIKDKDKSMIDKYTIVGYNEIADFIYKNLGLLKSSKYLYEKYVDDFANIFRNFGYDNKLEFFKNLFIDAISGI